mmetsp:Transcript_111338/g.300324  ORF Transcript_111338/g.300324 Transcript_111338/m.300324 type:complete len:479 (+) Transcript_111338:116-1552(+)
MCATRRLRSHHRPQITIDPRRLQHGLLSNLNCGNIGGCGSDAEWRRVGIATTARLLATGRQQRTEVQLLGEVAIALLFGVRAPGSRGARRGAWTRSRARRRAHLRPSGVWAGGGNGVVDAALPALDAEVAVLAPMRVPTVRNLPILDAVVRAPTDDLHRVAAREAPGDVVVDAARVVLEVRIHREGRLHGASGHDHLLDLLDAAGRHGLAREGVLVPGEVPVLFPGGRVALAGALRGLLAGAARLALGGERVLPLRTVVVAVRQREVRAHPLAEGPGALVLAARNGAVLLDVIPRLVDHAAPTTVVGAAEADVLIGERQHQRRVAGDAHAVRGRLDAREGPAAAAIGLVADVVNHLGALRPVGGRVETLGDLGGGQGRAGGEALDLAAADARLDGGLPVALHAVERLGGAGGGVGEPVDKSGLPLNSGNGLDRLDLGDALRVRGSRDRCRDEHCGGQTRPHGGEKLKAEASTSASTSA